MYRRAARLYCWSIRSWRYPNRPWPARRRKSRRVPAPGCRIPRSPLLSTMDSEYGGITPIEALGVPELSTGTPPRSTRPSPAPAPRSSEPCHGVHAPTPRPNGSSAPSDAKPPTDCPFSTNTTCERWWTATRTTTTTADHTKPHNSHHHDQTSRSLNRATPRHAADQPSAA